MHLSSTEIPNSSSELAGPVASLWKRAGGLSAWSICEIEAPRQGALLNPCGSIAGHERVLSASPERRDIYTVKSFPSSAGTGTLREKRFAFKKR